MSGSLYALQVHEGQRRPDSEPTRGRTGEMGTVQNLLYPGCGCGAGDPAETVEISHPRIRNGVVPDGSGDQ